MRNEHDVDQLMALVDKLQQIVWFRRKKHSQRQQALYKSGMLAESAARSMIVEELSAIIKELDVCILYYANGGDPADFAIKQEQE